MNMEMIEQAVSTLRQEGKRLSVRAVHAMTGGSLRDVHRLLRDVLPADEELTTDVLPEEEAAPPTALQQAQAALTDAEQAEQAASQALRAREAELTELDRGIAQAQAQLDADTLAALMPRRHAVAAVLETMRPRVRQVREVIQVRQQAIQAVRTKALAIRSQITWLAEQKWRAGTSHSDALQKAKGQAAWLEQEREQDAQTARRLREEVAQLVGDA
jgi:chromosome segregation ATPase